LDSYARDRLLVALRLPGLAGQDGQGQQRQREQADVQVGLALEAEPVREVRIGVAGQQRALEKHQAGGPHRRRAAEPRQDLLGDDRLHQKQQKGRQEDRAGIGQDRGAAERGRCSRSRRHGRCAGRRRERQSRGLWGKRPCGVRSDARALRGCQSRVTRRTAARKSLAPWALRLAQSHAPRACCGSAASGRRAVPCATGALRVGGFRPAGSPLRHGRAAGTLDSAPIGGGRTGSAGVPCGPAASMGGTARRWSAALRSLRRRPADTRIGSPAA